jgi:hypothetical protein
MFKRLELFHEMKGHRMANKALHVIACYARKT